MFWKKYNLSLRQPRLCFKISQGVTEWNSNELSKLLFFLLFKFEEENSMYMFWKYLKETMNGVLNGGKTLRERILKNIS